MVICHQGSVSPLPESLSHLLPALPLGPCEASHRWKPLRTHVSDLIGAHLQQRFDAAGPPTQRSATERARNQHVQEGRRREHVAHPAGSSITFRTQSEIYSPANAGLCRGATQNDLAELYVRLIGAGDSSAQINHRWSLAKEEQLIKFGTDT